MNSEIDLQQLWNSQLIMEIKPDFSLPEMILRLKKFEKKHKFVNTVKITSVSILLPLLIYILKDHIFKSLWVDAGLGLIIAAITIFIIITARFSFSVLHMDFTMPADTFIKKMIDQLNFEKLMIKRYIPFIALLLIAGINLTYVEILRGEPVMERIFYHLTLTILYILAIFLGLRVRIKRFKKNNAALIQDLEKIQEQILKA